MNNWVKKIFGFGLASFWSDLSHEMTISLIPVLVTQFVGPAQAPFFLGIISSVTDAFASLLRLVSGYLSDKVEHKKPLIAAGYTIAAIFSTLVGFANSVWGVLFYRTISFTGSGLREPPRDALIAQIIPPAYYGRAYGLRNAMDTLGSLLGPLVTFWCTNIFSLQQLFALSFIPGMLAAITIIFFTSDNPIAKKKTSFSFSFIKDLTTLPTSFIIFIGILFILDLSFFNKLLLLARAQEMLPSSSGSVTPLLVLLYAIFNLTRAIAEFTIGLLSDYINRIILLALFGSGTLSCVGFLLLKSQGSLFYCSIIFALAGVSTAAITTLKKSCTAHMLPLPVRGLGFGVMQASQGFALLIASALIGFLWTKYNVELAFSYVIVLSTISGILLLGFATGKQFTARPN